MTDWAQNEISKFLSGLTAADIKKICEGIRKHHSKFEEPEKNSPWYEMGELTDANIIINILFGKTYYWMFTLHHTKIYTAKDTTSKEIEIAKEKIRTHLNQAPEQATNYKLYGRTKAKKQDMTEQEIKDFINQAPELSRKLIECMKIN